MALELEQGLTTAKTAYFKTLLEHKDYTYSDVLVKAEEFAGVINRPHFANIVAESSKAFLYQESQIPDKEYTKRRKKLSKEYSISINHFPKTVHDKVLPKVLYGMKMHAEKILLQQDIPHSDGVEIRKSLGQFYQLLIQTV